MVSYSIILLILLEDSLVLQTTPLFKPRGRDRFSFYNEFLEPLPRLLNDIFPFPSDADPIVDTKNGLIQGTVKRSRDGREYFAFLGIPYAVPPLGNLRFEPPVKITWRWEGVQAAHKYAPPCFHLDVFFSGRLKGKEDCLYANVYTPFLRPKRTLPVMVYIHGGGYCSGSGDMYQGRYFMDEDVVLVVFNYRLSALGFLSTGDGIVKGNMALKDQRLLLQWVQENIEGFGGNPEKVTLFGESVGAAMTQFHILSPSSSGLFHKAIALSGSAIAPWALNENPSSSAVRLAKVAGCPTNDTYEMVNCLKSVPLETFLPEYKQMTKTVANPAEFFAPSVETVLSEDAFLTEYPLTTLTSGNFSKLPIIMGINGMEGLLYTARILVDPNALRNIDSKFSNWIPRYFYYHPNRTNLTNALKSYYFPNNKKIDLRRGSDFLNLTHLLGDGTFVYPNHKFASLYSRFSPVHMYFNTHEGRLSTFDVLRHVPLAREGVSGHPIPELSVGINLLSKFLRLRLTAKKPSSLGTSHGDIVFLLFNIRNTPGIGGRSLDYSASKAIIKTFVAFAASDSKDEDLYYNDVLWPKIEGMQQSYMNLDLPGRVVSQPFPDRIAIWRKLVG